MTDFTGELRLLLGDLRYYAAHAGGWQSDDPVEDAQTLLCDLGHLRGLLARTTSCAVAHARQRGLGWDEIGDLLGLPLPHRATRDHALDRPTGSIVGEAGRDER